MYDVISNFFEQEVASFGSDYLFRSETNNLVVYSDVCNNPLRVRGLPAACLH